MMQMKPQFIVVAVGTIVQYPPASPASAVWVPDGLRCPTGEAPALWRVVEIDVPNEGCIIERTVALEERDAFGFSRGVRTEQRWVFLDELPPLRAKGPMKGDTA
jgi:hypothetical protein